MKLSAAKREAVYVAISNVVLSARIHLNRYPQYTDQIDRVISRIEIDVFKEVLKALGVEDA